ncbi:MAG: hypothetical protein P4L93_04675 [Coriobacteriia bacterium]|nr:hypothetical protein [Coriobacteriia bacterium]
MTVDNITPIVSEQLPSDGSAPDADAAEPTSIGPLAAARLSGNDVQANLSAMGSVTAGSLSATGSAIGAASVEGDATITASMVPALLAKGDTTIQQSYASAMIVGGGGNTTVHQAVSPLIIGKTMDISQAGAGVLVTGDADVKSSWVGIVLAPKTTISENSRVIIDTKAAFIIAIALFGGLGLIALAVTLATRRLMRWRPTITIPGVKSLPQLPDLATLQEKWQQMRHVA